MKRYFVTLKLVVLIGLLNLQITNAQTFTALTGTSFIGTSNGNITWSDFNNDGSLDVLVCGTTILERYKNNGNGTFTIQSSIPNSGVSSGNAVWGDYDNDGNLDFLVVGSQGSYGTLSKIYHNNGDDTFTEQAGVTLPGIYSNIGGGIAWCDFDNDGYLDILLTGVTGSYPNQFPIAKIYHNNRNKTFTEITNTNLPALYYSVAACGDYDNDGFTDILLSGYIGSSKITKIFHNNGTGVFTEQTNISLPVIENGSAAWGDYDNDGYLDILISGDEGSTKITKIFHNNGNGNFTVESNAILIGLDYSSVAWGDYDNDGYLDILISGDSNSGLITKVYHNNGDRSFTEVTGISLKGLKEGNVSWGDYDNDGDIDILMNGSDGAFPYYSMIYKNNTIVGAPKVTNTAPSVPANLIASVNGGNVTLKWDKATDSETPQNGLNYNLYVYKSNSSNYKIAPNAILQPLANNGKRLVAQIGNIQYNASGYLLKIPSGVYSWSVQAIDAGLKGGNFASESSFVVVNVAAVNVEVAKGELTKTTIAMEYSLNSTNGTDGNWTICTDSVTSVNFNTGGFDVWVREKSLPSNKNKIATIEAQVLPSFAIDYVNETTDKVIKDSVEYSINPDMSSPVKGSGQKVNVTPGRDLYLRINATSTRVVSAIQHLVVPNRPPVPSYSIDYINENSNENIAALDEYAAKSDMSNATTGAGNKITITPGQNLYFKTKASSSNFTSLVQSLTIPNRPTVPSNPIINDVVNTFDWTNNTDFPNIQDYEYTLNQGASWTTCAAKPVNVGNLNIAVGDAQIRIKATSSSFKSEALKSNTAFSINTGIADLNSLGIKVYPNPVTNTLIIENISERIVASIYSAEGRLIETYELADKTNFIDVSKLTGGQYLLIITSSKIKAETKFIKK